MGEARSFQTLSVVSGEVGIGEADIGRAELVVLPNGCIALGAYLHLVLQQEFVEVSLSAEVTDCSDVKSALSSRLSVKVLMLPMPDEV